MRSSNAQNEVGDLKLNIKGLDVNCEVKGSGDRVFLMHGWGSDLTLFDKLSDVIAEKYAAVSFDFPGFGGSEEPKESWSVSDYSDFTVEFIKKFDCLNVILIGHSFGGRVVIKTASRDDLPFTVDKIILTGSAGIKTKKTPRQKARQTAYKLGKAALGLPPARKAAPRALERLKKRFGSRDYNDASEIMRGVLVKTVNEDLTPHLSGIKCPSLLIWGEDDKEVPTSSGVLMEKNIPDAALIVLKGAGHYPFLEQQFAFHAIVKSFLEIG
jgi:pimeloyl-ACP methyl ester carboxylesterase